MLGRFRTIASFPVFLLAARFIPFERIPSPCLFYHVTGYPCAFCGMTRSVAAIVRLGFRQAASLNPLGFIFMAILALWWGNSLYQLATGEKTRLAEWTGRNFSALGIAAVTSVVLFGIVRIWVLTH